MTKTVKITEPTWRKIDAMIKNADVGLRTASLAFGRDGTIRIQNYSSWACPQFGAMVIDHPWPIPQNNLDLFKRQRFYRASYSTYYRAPGAFIIALQPIAPMKFGLGMFCGITPAQIEVTNPVHQYAELVPSTAGLIRSTEAGPFEILFKEYDLGLKWALLRVGGPSTGRQMEWIKLTNVSNHPMLGRIAPFNVTAGAFPDPSPTLPTVQVYRYPTYTDNTLYDVGNVIAAVREAHGVYVALDTLPRQLATAEYTGWNP